MASSSRTVSIVLSLPPLYEREDIFEWHQERIPGDIRKPIFTTRCGIENKDDKIMIMDKIFNDRVINEGWNTVYNRYTNFRHNRGNFDKPSRKKRTERNKKIHSRDGKIAIKTLEYLQYLNESRAEQNERREKYMASFEQFGEVVEEEEDQRMRVGSVPAISISRFWAAVARHRKFVMRHAETTNERP